MQIAVLIQVSRRILWFAALWLQILLCQLLCSNQASAQSKLLKQEYAAYNISSSEFQNYPINSLLMDSQGSIWLGTEKGLYLSNGKTIRSFALANPNDKIINTIYEHDNYIYIGTNEGISRISLHTLLPEAIILKDEKGSVIHNYSMVGGVSAGGKLLFYTGHNRGAYYEMPLTGGNSRLLFNLSDGYRAYKTGANGQLEKLWAVESTGLLEHTLKEGKWTKEVFFKGVGSPLLIIHNAQLDNKDTLWCATNKGLMGMDIHTHSSREVVFKQYGTYEISDVILHGEYVICATPNAGILLWNRNTSSVSRIRHKPDDYMSLLSSRVSRIRLVQDKLLVAATDRGVSLIPLELSQQPVLTTVSSEVIHSLCAGPGEWFAGIGNKIYSCAVPGYNITDSALLAKDEYAITAEYIKPGWLVITNKRVLLWDDGAITPLQVAGNRQLLLYRIVKRSSNSYLLCGPDGLYEWQKESASLTNLQSTDKQAYKWYHNVIPTGEYTLLANAQLSFIQAYEQQGTDLYPKYLIKSFSNINAWWQIDKEQLLVAGSNGLNVLNLKSKMLSKVGNDFSKTLFHLIAYEGDTLLTGENELYTYKNNQIDPLPHPLSGLISISNTNTVITESGNLRIAKGNELRTIPLGLRLKENPYFYLQLLYKDKPLKGDLTIQSNSNLSIDINSICYLPYVSCKVQYKLTGVDANWNVLEGDHIRYTQLQPGNYTLHIRVLTGTQLMYSKLLEITAKPLWYQTKWALLGLIAILMFIVVAVFRWRIGALKTKSAKELALQRQLDKLENKALRAQMNPHFLFNTLNSINHYILNNDTDHASHYLTRFSRLVRLVLDNSRREWISLERELECLNIYLELEMMRRNEAFDYSIIVKKDVSASSFLVPPLILQPFVENAIWHGLASKEKDGFIEITAEVLENDGVCISIEDNGIGYVAKETTAMDEHNSFGMAGTRERLQLMHPKNDFTIQAIRNEQDEVCGTRVSVIIYND